MNHKLPTFPNVSALKRLILSGLIFLVAVTAFGAEPVTVQGLVSDETGEPLIGATVRVENTDVAVATNYDGEFTLSGIEKGATITVTYIGYQTKTVKADGSYLKITLSEDTSLLDEVVVVGYGTQKKVTLTGAVETVSSKQFQDRAVSNIGTALQGASPSLVVTRSSSRPGNEGLGLKIRGVTSVNSGGGSPLIIIDGIPALNYEQFYNLNPDDIDNISILKDGSASIYGAKAANGVILVTTKRGAEGKTRVEYGFNMRLTRNGIQNYQATMGEFASMWLAANAEQVNKDYYHWVSEENLMAMQSNLPGIYQTRAWGDVFMSNSPRTDELFGSRNSYEHKFSVAGGSGKNNYRLSLSYSDNQGNLVTSYDGQKVLNARLSYDTQLYSWLKLQTISSFNRTVTSSPSSGLDSSIYGYDPPFFPSKNPYGQWYGNFGYVGDRNAVAATTDGGRNDATRTTGRLDLSLTADIWGGISLEGKASVQAQSWQRERYVTPVQCYNWFGKPCGVYDEYGNYISPTYITTTIPSLGSVDDPGSSHNNPGYLKQSNYNLYQYYSLIARYNHKFNNIHDVEIMAGVQGEISNWNNLSAARLNFDDEGVYDLSVADASSTMATAGGKGSSGTLSYIGRINYNYDEKYLVSLLGRRDGDSKFAPGYRFCNFGGASAGWVFTREKFMEGVNHWWNFGKLRLSYGETGNNGGLGDYQFASGINQGYWYFGNDMSAQTSTSIKASGLINNSLTWERVIQKNIGVDLAFFNNRLTAGFDYFRKDNKGMLRHIEYPSVLGAAAPFSNSGHLAVNGWEVTLGWRSSVADFHYFVNFNIGDTRSLIKSMDNATEFGAGKNWAVVGYPVNAFFLYRTDGFFQNQQEVDNYYAMYEDGLNDMLIVRRGTDGELRPGDTKILDLNGDGKISGIDGDLQFVGDGNPHFTYGFNLGGNWRGIDLSATFQGVGKQYIQRTGYTAYPFNYIYTNQNPTFLGKTWTEENPDAKYPRMTMRTTLADWNYADKDFMLQNSRYCRLKTLVVGYTIPQKWTRKCKIEKLRVYFSGNDLWEWTSIKDGYDPEMGESSNHGGYPFARTYSFGVNVEL